MYSLSPTAIEMTDKIDHECLKLFESLRSRLVEEKGFELQMCDVDQLNSDLKYLLLLVALSVGSKQSVQVLIDSEVSVNKKLVDVDMKYYGLREDIFSYSPLFIVCQKIDTENSDNYYKFVECCECLLDHPDINVNYIEADGLSAFMFIVENDVMLLISKYLRNGFHLCDLMGKYNLKRISASTLVNHFDDCVTEIQNNKLKQKEYLLRYNNFECNENSQYTKYFKQIAFFEYLSKSTDHVQLLGHPLLKYFVHIQKKHTHHLWLWYYAMCFLFLTNIWYIAIYLNQDKKTVLHYVFSILTYFTVFAVSIREVYQIWYSISNNSAREYVLNYENITDFIYVVCVSYTILTNGSDYKMNTLSAITILIVVVELLITIESFPFALSIYIIMLKSVSKNYIKILIIYFVIIVSFALSFYCIFKTDVHNSKLIPDDDDEVDELDQFNSIWLSVVKTIVMFTGEFDAGDISYNKNRFSYFIFILFVFFVALVMLNLLHGLAVTDTQAIENEAELNLYVSTVRAIKNYMFASWKQKVNIKEIHVCPNVKKIAINNEMYAENLYNSSIVDEINELCAAKERKELERRHDQEIYQLNQDVKELNRNFVQMNEILQICKEMNECLKKFNYQNYTKN